MVKYRPQTLNGPRSMENQTLLLAKEANRVWRMWCEPDGKGGYLRDIINSDPEFDDAMRALKRTLTETDVFFSGVSAGRQEVSGE